MPRIDLFRTASFRIAFFYGGLFTASVLVLFAVIYLATTGYTARQLSGRIERELATLRTEYDAGGRDALIADIDARIEVGPSRDAYYLLQGRDGRVLVGNLAAMRPRKGWLDLTGVSDEGGHIRARGEMLQDGSFLLVGLDASRLDQLDESIVLAFLWGTATTFILAIVGAVLMSAVTLRRVAAMGRATEDIMAGNIDRRLPLTGGRDEFNRLAADVNLMLDRIEMLMHGLQQVSNDIAHDLKTPMSRLRQHLELARHGATSVEQYDRAVDRAIAECDVTLKTFDALLRIAQIEAGTRRQGFRPFDLSAVAGTVCEAYQPVAEESGQSLDYQLAPGATVTGDPDLLTQMMSNLVENALKHTPSGTRVEVRLVHDDERWRLIVVDDGPGIPEGEREKVFRRFYRLDRSRSTSGNGLGLSLVAAVVQLHGAGIDLADNAPGLRVTVTFRDRPVESRAPA